MIDRTITSAPASPAAPTNVSIPLNVDGTTIDALLGSGVASAPFSRSYRRLIPSSYSTYAASLVMILVLQVATICGLGQIAKVFPLAVTFALSSSGIPVATQYVEVLGGPMAIATIDVHPANFNELLLCIGGAIAAILCVRIKQPPTPLRYLVVFAALVLIVSAVQLLLTGRPSYEGAEFSSLWLQLSLVMWAMAPVLLGAASLLFPFLIRERATLIVSAIVIEGVFSIARYVVVLAVVSVTGSLIYPLAMTFGGVIADALIFVTLYSRALSKLSQRLSRSPENWQWSLR